MPPRIYSVYMNGHRRRGKGEHREATTIVSGSGPDRVTWGLARGGGGKDTPPARRGGRARPTGDEPGHLVDEGLPGCLEGVGSQGEAGRPRSGLPRALRLA